MEEVRCAKCGEWRGGVTPETFVCRFCLGTEALPAPAPLLEFVFKRDAIEWLKSLDSSSVDLAITDPAYESLEKHRAVGTTTRLKHSKSSSNDWFSIFPNSRFPELFSEFYRVLKPNSHLYLFCDQETMFIAKPMGEAAGFKFWKPLVWDKMKIGMGYHYRCRHEFILFFEKGKRKLLDLGIPDVIQVPRIHGGYPTEKPSAVSDVLIRQSSLPGQLVIDPFSGSGSVGVAAVSLDRRFAGCDISETAVKISNERITEAGDGKEQASGEDRTQRQGKEDAGGVPGGRADCAGGTGEEGIPIDGREVDDERKFLGSQLAPVPDSDQAGEAGCAGAVPETPGRDREEGSEAAPWDEDPYCIEDERLSGCDEEEFGAEDDPDFKRDSRANGDFR